MLRNPAHQSHDRHSFIKRLESESQTGDDSEGSWILTQGGKGKQSGSREMKTWPREHLYTTFQTAIVPDSGNEREEK